MRQPNRILPPLALRLLTNICRALIVIIVVIIFIGVHVFKYLHLCVLIDRRRLIVGIRGSFRPGIICWGRIEVGRHGEDESW